MGLGTLTSMLCWTHSSPEDPAEPWQGSNFLQECAYGGPPQHLTEAWQLEMWHILGMKNPLEHSHQRDCASSPGTCTPGYGLSCPAPDRRKRSLSRTNICLPVAPKQGYSCRRQFVNQHRVRVEALQTAAPKHEVEVANPLSSGASQSVGDESFCVQMTP